MYFHSGGGPEIRLGCPLANLTSNNLAGTAGNWIAFGLSEGGVTTFGGGTTFMSIDKLGARYAVPIDMRGNSILGVADGTLPHAAVNFGQLTSVYNNGTKYFRTHSTGSEAVATGQDATAIGPRSLASGDSAFAAGNGAQATGKNAIAIGAGALATGSQAIGADARAGGGGAAFGDQADAGGTPLSQAQNISKGTAIGYGAVVTQGGGVALGSGSVASRAAGVAGYIPSTASPRQEAAIKATTATQAAVSVGDAATGQYRQITGVAAGLQDSDAANVAQVRAAANSVAAASSQYETNPDGSINYNHLTLGNGRAPNGTRISNVAAGIAPTDAVNVGQLTSVQNRLQGQIRDTQRIAYSGVAMATAMSTMPQAMTPGKGLLSAGVGHYAGYGAMAIGYSARSSDGKWVYKVNGGVSASKFNVGVGIGYEF